MTVLRSPRLEALLGGVIPTAGSIKYRHLELLKAGQVGEAEDLEYKRELYGNGDSQRRELCKDVAALANTRGGLLVIGIQEDDQGRAISMTNVALSDAEATRMHQAIASGVHPLPTFEIIPVEDPAQPGAGCYAVSVAAGPRQPYGVAVNNGYRYPRRVGMTVVYLTEPEIETAYRRRDAARRDQNARAREIEEATARRLPTDRPWVMVSLVPDQPGDVRLDATSFSKARTSYQSANPMIMGRDWSWRRVLLGQRRLILDDQYDYTKRAAIHMMSEVHDDGSGTFAGPSMFRHNPDAEDLPFNDELLVNIIMSGLRFLGEHARERAHAAGSAMLRLTIVPGRVRKPWQLYHHDEGWGTEPLGNQADQVDFQTAEAAAPIDELVDGPGLVSASAILGSEIFQGFGLPEVPQITQRGQIRQRYWAGSRDWLSALEAWAKNHGIEVIDEVIATR
ncbi:AlbA family DNA-binding domain-containing protein [[Actinomadura] parvosata]|uniref:AlbA family DNA-binding domain-containing protein n=1 Tax=[Actinomadura] parvosata TaxID=1955412 RepID=UPI00406C9FC4